MSGTQMPVAPTATVNSGTTGAPGANCLALGSVQAGSYYVREGGPGDESSIRAFATGLSETTRYLRLFTPISPSSPSFLRVLTGGIPGSDILVITDQQGTVVGHGIAVGITADGRPAVDLGLVIADAWQGQGLGSVLLELLTRRASSRGAHALAVEVLPANSRMLALFSRYWPNARRAWNGDAFALSADIADMQQPGAVAATPRCDGRPLSAAVSDMFAISGAVPPQTANISKRAVPAPWPHQLQALSSPVR